MSPRTITLIILLTAAALGSWYLSRSKPDSSEAAVSVDRVHRGYYLKQARILGTGSDGSLLYEIEAQHAEQLEDDRIEFTDVRIRYSPDSNVPWIVNADQAILREGAPKITLHGHVQILNPGNDDSDDDDTEIRTEHIELDPDDFTAETDARVQIRFGSRSVTATGMLASLNDDQIELKSNVRGKIAP